MILCSAVSKEEMRGERVRRRRGRRRVRREDKERDIGLYIQDG